MTYSLNTIVLDPLSKEKPKNAMILCHGYGGDGKDISLLASYWKNYLPETIFICPDAPEKCAVSPTGFQWFDLMDITEDEILARSLIAEMKLNKLIDEVKSKNNLNSDQIGIGGFSQGCMISLQAGLKRKDKVRCILGYSGKIINPKHLEKNINSRPEIMLMHGEKDDIVPFYMGKELYEKANHPKHSYFTSEDDHMMEFNKNLLGALKNFLKSI